MPDAPDMSDAPDVPESVVEDPAELRRQAVRIVRDDLPDAPVWKKAKIKGRTVSGNTVCVEITGQFVSEKWETNHYDVDLDRSEVGEAEEGRCSSSNAGSDPAEEAQTVFMRMDDIAVQGDRVIADAIDTALEDRDGSRVAARLERLYRKARTIADPLFGDGPMGDAAASVASAIANARDALLNRDPKTIVRQRNKLREARDQLAAALRN